MSFKDFAKRLKSKENSVTGVAEVDETLTPTIEKWVWVEGYKGTDRDMRCRDQQFEIGKSYVIPQKDVSMCESGFHLCKKLIDVYTYYDIHSGNRFFKVRALVRQEDLDRYGCLKKDSMFSFDRYDKLVASEIEFLEELSVDDILENTLARNWPEEYKKMAIELGIDKARDYMNITILLDLGYSETFAKYIIESKKFNIAKAVGSQSDLSMDMKVWTIFHS